MYLENKGDSSIFGKAVRFAKLYIRKKKPRTTRPEPPPPISNIFIGGTVIPHTPTGSWWVTLSTLLTLHTSVNVTRRLWRLSQETRQLAAIFTHMRRQQTFDLLSCRRERLRQLLAVMAGLGNIAKKSLFFYSFIHYFIHSSLVEWGSKVENITWFWWGSTKADTMGTEWEKDTAGTGI